MTRCFVMQPFDNGKFDKRFDDIFKKAIEDAGLSPYRVDRDPGVNVPIEDIEKGIIDSEICFAEITTDNPNVWFELGYAIAAGKPVCLICSKERKTPFPFDIRHRRIIEYGIDSLSDYKTLGDKITERLKAMLKNQENNKTISSLQPATITEGLSPHEVAALTLTMSSHHSEGGVLPFDLKNKMTRAGFNELAVSIAIEELMRKALIERIRASAPGEDDWEIICMTEEGINWILNNKHTLNLRSPKDTPRTDDDDIPF